MGGVTRSRTAGFIRRATWAANKQEHTDTLDRVAARPRRWGTRKVKETVKGSSYNKSQRQGLRHTHQEERLTRFRVVKPQWARPLSAWIHILRRMRLASHRGWTRNRRTYVAGGKVDRL